MSLDVPMFALVFGSIDYMDFWWTCSWIVIFVDRRSTKTTERDRCNHHPHSFQHELSVKRILNQVPQVHLLFPYYQEVKIHYC